MPLPLLTEYSDALVDAIYRTCPAYQVVTRPDRTPYFVAGAFGCVFKAINPTNNRLLAIKCFTKHVNNKQQRLEAVATYLNQQKSPYTLHYRYLPNELWVGGAERADYYPILLMEWVEGETLGQAIQNAVKDDNKARLQQLADNFTDLALWLLSQPIAHTDLKHDNILVKPNNSLVLIDYDGMFVPALANYPAENKGVEEYQHPQRQLSDFNQHLDDFSIALIAAALYGLAQQPTLYNQYGSPDNLLFKAEDFKQPKNSPLWRALQALHHPIITPLLDQLLTALQTNSLQLPRLSTTLQPLPNTIQATEALIAQKKQELLRLQQHLTHLSLQQYLTHLKNAPTPNTRSSKLREANKEQKVKVIDLSGVADTTPTLNPLPQPIQQLLNDLVAVEGGTFIMGSDEYSNEKPIHQVRLDTFKIAKYQVTQAQWQAIMGSNPSRFKGDPNLPVENVSWDDIQVFLEKLNQKTGKEYRLPTEAEWEYAARGGNKSQGYTYAGSNNLNEVAWYDDNSGNKTHPVGQKKPNELGIYDMSGNVWEWCQDWYDEDYYKNSSANNPTGPTSGSYRVLRGGSWYSIAAYCRVANRDHDTPSDRYYNSGFRLAVR